MTLRKTSGIVHGHIRGANIWTPAGMTLRKTSGIILIVAGALGVFSNVSRWAGIGAMCAGTILLILEQHRLKNRR